MRKLTALDVFCGAGGFSLGFEQAGFRVVAGVDNVDVNVITHRQNFPESMGLLLDLSDVHGEALLERVNIRPGKLDVLLGGPPCQGFSVAGRMLVEDERNLLLHDFARLVCQIRPRYFVLENVPGLLFKNAQPHLSRFLRRIRRGGYRVIEPIRTLDAAEFGVPQSRRRVVILGYREGCKPPAYPSRVGPTVTVWDAIGDLPDVDAFDALLESDVYGGPLGTPSKYAKSLRSRRRTLSGCLRTVHAPEVTRRFADTLQGTCEPISRFFRLPIHGQSRALRAGTDRVHGSHTAARPIHPLHPRCITVREAARLHSFPDWFEFNPTKWHGFRQVGNSVPPLMAKAIAESLLGKPR